MIYKFLLATGLMLASVGLSFAQDSPFMNEHVAQNRTPQTRKNQVLVSMEAGISIKQLSEKYPELFSRYGLTVIKQVAKTMNIWLLEHQDSAKTAEVLIALHQLPEVRISQVNHVIQKRDSRLLPNDTRYTQQWQYNNTGSNGGVAGADIDAELAWFITTGGFTPNGDTIVVAVVDDGMDTTIADLRPNWWKNNNEIPNNGIDDDGNEYIDDYRGWNAYDNDDEIYSQWSWDVSGWHGSSVAGIVGAKGNDSSGVTGVNWDVKLMIIAGGGDEAEAIAAYEYALQNRKIYDATGGAKGAYVVATNSSWGVDELFYTDAPLWCAFYDSLGRAGIMSAGATANENWNIEVRGDMPTTCPSDYLVAVTNTKRNDVKETFAGYGIESIDLGAPGEDAYTVDALNGFAGFGGTSGATPHVAGAIALLYSVPNQEFADLAAAYPDSAAIWVKRFILEGVDSNASLQSKSVTGGRLNLFGAIEKMYEYFPDEPDTTGTVGLADFWLEGIKIYPNPATEELVLFLPSLDLAAVQLLSVDGKVVKSIAIAEPSRIHRLTLLELPAAIYVLELTSQSGSKSFHRIIKQ